MDSNHVASGLMCIWDVDSEIHIWVLTLLILGLGFGLLLTSITAVCQAMADTNDVSFATALYTFSRILGMCIGVAIGGAAFQNKITTAPMDRKLPAAIAEEATVFVYEVKAMPMGPKKELFLEAYADGFKGVFIVFTAIAGIAWLAGLLVLSRYPRKNVFPGINTEVPASTPTEATIIRALPSPQHHHHRANASSSGPFALFVSTAASQATRLKSKPEREEMTCNGEFSGEIGGGLSPHQTPFR